MPKDYDAFMDGFVCLNGLLLSNVSFFLALLGFFSYFIPHRSKYNKARRHTEGGASAHFDGSK